MKKENNQPPKWADWFLEWFCHPDLLEEIQGDAYELFYARCKKSSPRIAKWRYVWDVFRSFRLSTIKNIQIAPIMLKNNFKIAFRQIKRQKFYSGINIIGLAIGIACCLLIGLYIKDELSYDRYHTNIDNLYRVALDINLGEWEGQGNCIPPILPPTLVEEIPEIEKAARINPFFSSAGTNLLRKVETASNKFEKNFVYADQSLFELFDFPLKFGEANNLLKFPNTVVISQRIQEKYYPHENPVGKSFILNDNPNETYKITGVFKKVPAQSHFKYDYYLSMPSLENSKATSWISNNYFAYVALKEGSDLKVLNQKLKDFSLKHFVPAFKKNQNLDLIEKAQQGQYYRVFLKPVKDIHLHSGKAYPHLGKVGDIQYVRLFALIAVFVFIIALVNFINLSTARSANRAVEVGVRKVLGSFHSQLISQFLIEAILMSFLAFIIGILLAYAFLPFFNELSGKNLNIPFYEFPFIITFISSILIIGLLAGLYPAFYLSSFQPIKVLKGKLSRGSKSTWLQSSLVIGQFAISIGLILATIIVYQQISHIQNKKIGFDKEQVLLIQDSYILREQLNSFKQSLKDIPEVKNASISSFLPLDGGRRNSMAFYINPAEGNRQEQLYLQNWAVDEDYISTLSMEIKAGRNFKPAIKSDSLGIILNETAVQQFGLKDPIGKKIESPFLPSPYTIIGVVKDFNYESVRGEVRPLGLFLGQSRDVISVKASSTELESLIAKTEDLWKEFVPHQPFRYTFLDSRFAQMYITENQVGKVFGLFSVLAIFIACLGLFAMTTYITEQKTKEIGIRKVLGASIPSLLFLLSKRFLYLVLIGLLIAVPIAWIQMDKWLNDFSYRINVEWWMVALAGLSVIFIAILTIGGQALKAALANPIDSLKTE
jgi:putative ABC transport system permease protein